MNKYRCLPLPLFFLVGVNCSHHGLSPVAFTSTAVLLAFLAGVVGVCFSKAASKIFQTSSMPLVSRMFSEFLTKLTNFFSFLKDGKNLEKRQEVHLGIFSKPPFSSIFQTFIPAGLNFAFFIAVVIFLSQIRCFSSP